MTIIKKLPWMSLGLVIATYSVLGWKLSHTNSSWTIWLLSAIAIFIMNMLLNSPWSIITDTLSMLFKSDFRSFSVTVFGALLFFAIIAWFRLFLLILLMICTIVLVRIDFQAYGFKEWQAFWISATFSLLSLSNGALIYHIIYMIPLLVGR
ncbi:MAG: hypothetical protein AAF378_13820 [Cyanobacteria bacterium P01_A01_bin.84]